MENESCDEYEANYERMKNEFMTHAKIISDDKGITNNLHWHRSHLNQMMLQIEAGNLISGTKIHTKKGTKCLALESGEEIIPYSECFDMLMFAHLATDHGAEQDMKEYIQGNLFPFFCMPLIIRVCCKKDVPPPNSWQVFIFVLNLYEFGSILIYREMTINYVFLRPLRTGSAEEIAIELLQLFLQFGMPNHLLFTMQKNTIPADIIVDIMKNMHPPCGDIKYCFEFHTNRSAEFIRISRAIWSMVENCDVSNWTLDCHFTQYTLNMTRTVLYNYERKFLSTGVPFELFMAKGANVKTRKNVEKINAMALDKDNNYNYKTSKINKVQPSPEESDKFNSFLIYKLSKSRSDQIRCPICKKNVSEQFKCCKCNLAVHTICGTIKMSEKYEIECNKCANNVKDTAQVHKTTSAKKKNKES